MLYKKTIQDTAAKMSIRVDDKEEIIIDTFFKDGWGDYSATEVLVEDLLNGRHKIEIKDNSMREWKEIRLEDGKVGWIPASAIEVI